MHTWHPLSVADHINQRSLVISEILAYIDGNSTINLTALLKRNDYKQLKRWRSKPHGPELHWLACVLYLENVESCFCHKFTFMDAELLPSSLYGGERDLSKAALSQRQWQTTEANSKPTCSLWARVTCLASANHFLSEANSRLGILCPSGFADPVQRFPACRK